MRGLLVFIAVAAVVLAACGQAEPAPEPAAPTKEATGVQQFDAYPEIVIDLSKTYTAVITTNLGTLTFELLPIESPRAVNNFVFLAREGFYDGVIFHRVIPGFMAQSGDPTGTGTGGPGYSFAIEKPQRPYVRGSLAMANRGVPNTNGAQFFIVFTDLTERGRLAPEFSLFGQMIDGEEALAKIEAVPVGSSGTGETSRPLEEIQIESVEISES